MTRINMGSDSTLIAVASIPPRIWEQDKDIWKAYITALKGKASLTTRQKYKKIIADFYYEANKAILEVTEADFDNYSYPLWAIDSLATSTVKQRMNIVRAYWKFAQAQPTNAQQR